MRLLLITLLSAATVSRAIAGPMPLTAKEIGLMLRTGYSSNSVENELATRHFADTLDEAKEATLVKAGASPKLIGILKNGTYSLSPEKTAQVQQEIANQSKRRAQEAEASRSFDTLYQDQLGRRRGAATQTAQSTTGSNTIYQMVKGDLVHMHDGAMTRFDDDALENKKLIALYFSAHWCGPCRKFTPHLVDYYNRVAPQHPEFELIFVSDDRSQFGFETYMHDANMPWPAIHYQKLREMAGIRKYAGGGIPCLVLVDASGKVISDSFAGKQYLGPQKVLSDLDAIFAGKAVPAVAAAH
jgi:nucleoredoxin